MYETGLSTAVIASKHCVRSTLEGWEKQPRLKNKKVSLHAKAVHLQSSSGRSFSYPCMVDEELVDWVMTRRDCHLPVGTNMIQSKATALIKPHNPTFKASKGWLHKFMLRNGLSLRYKTSISQKLPAQLERKIGEFLTRVRAL